MSKVILPEYVAEYLEFAKSDTTLMRVMELANTRNEWEKWEKEYDWIEVNHEKFARAWLDGYEVEPEFKVGDWVVRTKELDHQNFHEGKIFKINSVIKSKLTKELMVVDADDNSEHIFNNIRHATPEEIAEEKERRWWAKHGREPWELRTDDVLTRNDDGFPWFVDGKRDTLPGYYLNGESFNLQDIIDRYRVMVFVENRLDVKDDE